MEEIRKRVWFESLAAEMNRRYFGYLAADYYALDLYSKIFLAFMASGTVAGWVIWKDPVAYPYGVLTWKILSSISAVLSITIPAVNIAKKLEAASKLKGGWTKVAREYDNLWLRVDDVPQSEVAAFVAELDRIGKLESDLDPLESILPTNKTRLIRRCQNEVKRARGI